MYKKTNKLHFYLTKIFVKFGKFKKGFFLLND